MNSIIEWDRSLLRHINADWRTPFFDGILPFLRNSDFWAPLYFFMLLFGVTNFKRTGWWWVLAGVATAFISDFTSSNLIKEHIFRLRPCNDPAVTEWLKLIPGIHCPQSSSFTSSHAVNHFAISAFFYFTLKPYTSRWIALFFVWAAAVGYAQVYVGVHYPTDIIGGALAGLLIGYIIATTFNKKWGLA